MPVLTDLAAVQAAIGSFPSADLENAVEDAIENASLELEAALGTTFDRATRQDDFMIDYRWLPAGASHVLLKLTQGFVLSTGLTVKAARAVADFGTSAELDITANCDIDLEKGIVSIARETQVTVDADFRFTSWSTPSGGVGRVYFRVQYSAGFVTTGSNPAVYTITGYEWLKRLATLKVRIVLDQHPVFRQNESTTDHKLLASQYDTIVQQKTRYAPRASLPKATRVV